MDATDVSKAVHAFFLQQRKKGCLLTTAEFEGVKKSSGLIFRSKNRLSRIIGRDYIEAKAAELQLTNLKAPKKLIIINHFTKKIVVDIASICGI